jgi:uncharacterized membrane protein YfcA
MLYGVSLNEIFWLVLLILVGGVISGLLAGLFGVGGGSIIVPVLFECFRAFGCFLLLVSLRFVINLI